MNGKIDNSLRMNDSKYFLNLHILYEHIHDLGIQTLILVVSGHIIYHFE